MKPDMSYKRLSQLVNTELDSLVDASILQSKTAKKLIEHSHPLMAQKAMIEDDISQGSSGSSSMDSGWLNQQAVSWTSPDVIIPRPNQRIIPTNPFQSVPCQPISRTRPDGMYPTSSPGTSRPQKGRDISVSAQLHNNNDYQSTHVIYDLNGLSTYEERPTKMQRLVKDYQVSHVGYDLYRDHIYLVIIWIVDVISIIYPV